jgi:hypothetical protein
MHDVGPLFREQGKWQPKTQDVCFPPFLH